MNLRLLVKAVSVLFFFQGVFMIAPSDGLAQENATGSEVAAPQEGVQLEVGKTPQAKALDVKISLVTNHEEMKKIDEEVGETREDIEQKAVEAEKSQKDAEEALTEKAVLEQDVTIKEKAAEVAKQELAAVKKEAVVTKDAQTIAKADKLAHEAAQLEGEASVQREKVVVMDAKAQAAQDAAMAHQMSLDILKTRLAKLEQEKLSKRGWIDRLINGAIVIVIGLVLFLLLGFGIRKFEHFITEKDAIRESEKTLQMKTIASLFRWLGSLAIICAVAYMFLEHLGFSMAPLLAGAGIIGLAFGFGGQYLIRDVINGIFILFEGQYHINDIVRVGETGGLVEGINLRVTRLRDLEGRVIYIPNGEIKTLINYTKGYAQALLDIGVAYKENVDQVIQVMKDVSKEMQAEPYFARLILNDMEMLGVDDFADSAVVIKCRMKTLPSKQWEIMREYRRRLKNRFDELGIEIPFPHRTIYWGAGQDRDGWSEKGKGE